MLDRQKRMIDYLRISVTDRCDLRCVYCMPSEGVEPICHETLLSYEEIIRLCRIFASLGLKKVRITGGEPLVRKEVHKLIRGINLIEGIEYIAVTTNGMHLKDQIDDLTEAGLGGVNISIDALEEDVFQKITRRSGVSSVKQSIEAALQKPQLNVKLNCVPMGINDSQLVLLAGLARRNRLSVRFIELMPIGLGKTLEYRSEADVLGKLERAFGIMLPYKGSLGCGPCHYYQINGFQGKIGFISAMSHKFCDNCNRVRLTASGFLKTCLQYDKGVDLKALLRQETSDEIIQAAIEQAIFEKPICHHFTDTDAELGKELRLMSQIGG